MGFMFFETSEDEPQMPLLIRLQLLFHLVTALFLAFCVWMVAFGGWHFNRPMLAILILLNCGVGLAISRAERAKAYFKKIVSEFS